jgi:hypothetical protein
MSEIIIKNSLNIESATKPYCSRVIALCVIPIVSIPTVDMDCDLLGFMYSDPSILLLFASVIVPTSFCSEEHTM